MATQFKTPIQLNLKNTINENKWWVSRKGQHGYLHTDGIIRDSTKNQETEVYSGFFDSEEDVQNTIRSYLEKEQQSEQSLDSVDTSYSFSLHEPMEAATNQWFLRTKEKDHLFLYNNNNGKNDNGKIGPATGTQVYFNSYNDAMFSKYYYELNQDKKRKYDATFVAKTVYTLKEPVCIAFGNDWFIRTNESNNFYLLQNGTIGRSGDRMEYFPSKEEALKAKHIYELGHNQLLITTKHKSPKQPEIVYKLDIPRLTNIHWTVNVLKDDEKEALYLSTDLSIVSLSGNMLFETEQQALFAKLRYERKHSKLTKEKTK